MSSSALVPENAEDNISLHSTTGCSLQQQLNAAQSIDTQHGLNMSEQDHEDLLF